MSDIVSPKSLLDVLDPSITPQATQPEKLDALKATRELFVDGTCLEETIDALLALDGMTILKPYLRDDDDEVLVEAAWIMTNIASSTAERCKVLIEHGIHEELGRLLEHSSAHMAEPAVWALGNIAGDCAANRDAVLQCGIADKLCVAFERADSSSIPRENIAWAILSLCRQRPRPDDVYLVPIYRTLHKALSSLVDGGLGCLSESKWLCDMLLALSHISSGSSNSVQRCLAFDLPQLVLKLWMQEQERASAKPEVSSTEVVQRCVASEQLGEVLSYLPHPDLVRLCAVSKDVFIASVCDHKEVYTRLRLNYILATHEMRFSALRIIGDVLGGDDEQTTVALEHGAAKVLEAMALLPDLKAQQKKELLWAFSNLAGGTEEHARVVLSSDVLLDTIGKAFYSTEKELVHEASCVLSTLREFRSFDSQFTEFPRFVDKVLIPAIALCLFHCGNWANSFVGEVVKESFYSQRYLRDVYELFETELPSDRKAAIEQRIELSGLSQRKQQEQLSIVDALWDRGTRARRRDASVEDTARRLRVYWGFLQGCWSELGGGVGYSDGDHGSSECIPCLGFNEVVFLMYQEVSEAINVLNRKREREE